MPDLVELATWLPLLLFVFGVNVAVFVLRRLVEGLIPRFKVNYYWEEVAMPIMPHIIGMLGALAFPFPNEWFMTITARQAMTLRLTLGLAGGALSGKAYLVVKKVILRKTGVDIDAAPDTPKVAVEPPKAA